MQQLSNSATSTLDCRCRKAVYWRHK